MAIFGKSVFQSVLDELSSDAEAVPDEEAEPSVDSVVRGPNASFLLAETLDGAENDSPISDLYNDFGADAPGLPEVPAWAGRLSIQDVIADLALSGTMNEDELRRRRREFAHGNHPDRVSEVYKDEANTRMTIANMLIDDAIRKQT
jgi:hypothetical protein